jgi:hypothetical protein
MASTSARRERRKEAIMNDFAGVRAPELNCAVLPRPTFNVVVKANALVLSHQLSNCFFIQRDVSEWIWDEVPELYLNHSGSLIRHLSISLVLLS